ncbi:MAG: FIG00659286: hypothetical protein, partial [uncultured Blastococcus sp.]
GYIGRRARTSIRRGLRAAAACCSRRRVRGPHGSLRGLRRQSLPLPGGEVPRRGDLGGLPGVPQGAPHPGELRLRRPPGTDVGPGEDRVRARPDGCRTAGVHRVRGRGLPELRVEPSGLLLRPGCRDRARAAAPPRAASGRHGV